MLNSGTRLVQKYIEDIWIYRSPTGSGETRYPFLSKMENKKFDIRMWVLVKSFCPLQAFIYSEGYLRLSREEYQLTHLGRNCTHLTNFSLNWQQSPQDSDNSYVMLSEFLQYLQLEGLKGRDTMMRQIQALVQQTLQSTDLTVSSSDSRCF